MNDPHTIAIRCITRVPLKDLYDQIGLPIYAGQQQGSAETSI